MKPWVPAVIAAIMFWGVSAFFRKLALRTLPVSSAMLFEGIGAAVVILLFWGFNGFQVFREVKGISFALLTGAGAVGGAIFILYALKQGPVSVISALAALSALITVVLGYLVLHEQLAWRHMAGIGLGLAAAVLLAL